MFALIAVAFILSVFAALAMVLSHAENATVWALRVQDACTPVRVYSNRTRLLNALEASHTKHGRMRACMDRADFTGAELLWFR